MPIDIPDDFFSPPLIRDEIWPDHPDLRRAVDWLKGFMTETEWQKRRITATNRLYDAALGKSSNDDKGRFFKEEDIFGWYLFLGEAFLDHIWNYEPIYGARVIPILIAIGRNLELLQKVEGIDSRVHRLVNAERRQPNGCLFELLVAGAYCLAGWRVAFVPEKPGRAKTHDMDVTLNGRTLAVECKRMETGEYGERERLSMRELWGPSAAGLSNVERNTFCDVHFVVPIEDVPPHYLTQKSQRWMASGLATFNWSDDICSGTIGNLDLQPLRQVLAKDEVLSASSRIHELLTGRYIRNANYVQLLRMKCADNPRYMNDCDLAILLRWDSVAPAAIDAKARDIIKKLAVANEQLPADRPGVIHIGFEAVEGDAVERLRYEKILASTAKFDPNDKPLEYVYCHYFVPESPPDKAWDFSETMQSYGIRPIGPNPLEDNLLVLPETVSTDCGAHWQV